MSEFPDSDEEFELMYGEELDLIKEQDTYQNEEDNVPYSSQVIKTKKTLNFNNTSNKNSINHKFTLQTTSQTSQQQHHNNKNNEEDLPDIISSLSSSSNSRKRLADDILEDIDNIENYDYLNHINNSKKHKKNDKLSRDLQLIDLIIQKRNDFKKAQSIANGFTNSCDEIISRDLDRNERNLSSTIPKYPFVKIKTFNGDNLYVRFHSEEYEKQETRRLLEGAKSFQGIMGDNFKNAWNEANEIILKSYTNNDDPNNEENNARIVISSENQMWVEMYKPKKYLELLSDESINRIMLKWLKLWDKVVFKRRPKIKRIIENDPQENNNKQRFFLKELINTNLDEHDRPYQKVVLLCGPPGLGKTTLAHLVAKHAGYNVVEINASDERSIEAFRTTLENSTQMQSVMDHENRPNCIVFDEIDGAPSASINLLVKYITGEIAINKGNNIKSKKSKQNKSFILKRPIICICNDAYVPALRPLRQIAFILNFPATANRRLAERLMEIAESQKIRTDLGVMSALAEKSNHDIRSCLSVLHFYKVQNKPIGLTDIYKTSIGQKDVQKDLFTVWRDIFEIKRGKLNALPTMKERMEKVLSTVILFGDQERVSQGIYENYLQIQRKDKGLDDSACGIDWFSFNDLLTTRINSDQNYSIAGYLNYAFVAWHFCFATFTHQRPKLNYPSSGYEYRKKQQVLKGIISQTLRGMALNLRCYQTSLSLILDVFPLIIRIINPQFRPVTLQLYSEEERKSLVRIANIMTEYNLTYIQERNTDGVYQFKLDPCIDEIGTFDKTEKMLNNSSNVVKQIIAREIELGKIRKNYSNNQNQNHSHTLEHIIVKVVKPNSASSFSAKAMIRKDFFGRIIEPITQSSTSTEKSKKISLPNDIWFQYKEGYSNAVKRRIKIKSLK